MPLLRLSIHALKGFEESAVFKDEVKETGALDQSRIRNHLLAHYFPEFDRYFGKGCSESLEIVKWCLNPSMIAEMEYKEFAQLVAPRMKTIGQNERVKSIWGMAFDSIGCEGGQALDFEAKLMVEDMHHIKDALRAVKDHIEDICYGFPEYRYLLTIPDFVGIGVGPW